MGPDQLPVTIADPHQPGSNLPSLAVRHVADSGEGLDYVLGEVLGAGGMGEVRAARQPCLDRVVALKQVHPAQRDAIAAMAGLASEAVLTSRLEHPNIVPVHEVARDQHGRLFYTMRRIAGRPWSERLGDMDLDANLTVLGKVTDAVAFAHSRGIIHRDLKPHNVMVGDFGEVFVVDWGVATRVGGASPGAAAVGTLAYMAPEMLDDPAAVGVASDVYLLGAILFHLVSGQPPHVADDLDALRATVRANVIPAATGDEALLRIAHQAMRSDPTQRFPDAGAFQAALHGWHANRVGAALVARARELERDALANPSYDAFVRATQAFAEAAMLTPSDPATGAGRARVRLAHAELAHRRGDFELAAGLLEPGHPDHERLRAVIANARSARERAMTALAQLAIEQQARSELEAERDRRDATLAPRWQIIVDESFDAGFTERWRVIGGEWRIEAGGLRQWGGTPQLLLLRRRVLGDVRIEFTCRQDGHLNDLTCFAAARSEWGDGATPVRGGYEFKCGGFDNTRTCLYRAGQRLFDRRHQPIIRGRSHQIVAQRIQGRLSLALDGEIIFDVVDPEPLSGSDRNALGLFGWEAETLISRIRISVLAPPQVADLGRLAYRHLGLGNYAVAQALFADAIAADDGSGGSDADHGKRLEAGQALATRLEALQRTLPALCARLQAALPGVNVTLDDAGLTVGLPSAGISDLGPLSGLPIVRLRCSGNRIASLGPLRGMPLEHLDCDNNQIADLEPLTGMPLIRLTCNGNPLSDLTPLRGLPLQSLDAMACAIHDLSPLTCLPLTRLSLDHNPIGDLEPLRGLPLTLLSLQHTQVSELDPLRGMPLMSLALGWTRVSDLGPLAGLQLTRLGIDLLAIADTTPLSGLPLRALSCQGCGLRDLAFLRGCALSTLVCGDNGLTSLEPLTGMQLGYLAVNGNRISDLGPLRGMPLTRLACARNPLSDLSPLFDLPLVGIDVDGDRLDAESAEFVARVERRGQSG